MHLILMCTNLFETFSDTVNMKRTIKKNIYVDLTLCKLVSAVPLVLEQ